MSYDRDDYATNCECNSVSRTIRVNSPNSRTFIIWGTKVSVGKSYPCLLQGVGKEKCTGELHPLTLTMSDNRSLQKNMEHFNTYTYNFRRFNVLKIFFSKGSITV